MVNWVKSCYQKFVHFFFLESIFFIMSTFLDELNFEKKNKNKKKPAQRNIEHDLFALKMDAVHNRLTHDTKNKLVSCKINHDKQLSDLSALIIALLLALIIYQ